MDIEKRFLKWNEQLREGKDGIEGIYITDDTCIYVDENGRQNLDCVYFRILQGEKVIMESHLVRDVTPKPYPICRFIMKEGKKILFARQGTERTEFYGYGFGETGKHQSILLYIRTAYGADLYFSDVASDTVSKMYGSGEGNPAALDSLIKIITDEKRVVPKTEDDEG